MRILGVDLGGSRLRAILRDGAKRPRAFARARPDPRTLPGALRKLSGSRRLDGLVVGARGVWTESERGALARRLSPLARRVLVLSDVELAWLASLGGRAGVVIIAGTGSIAYGKNAAGKAARAGGLGPLLGDEGSAFWIGREWLRSRPDADGRRLAARPDAVRAIAALAPAALRARPKLASAAAGHLAALAERCALSLRLSRRVLICCHGGLFAHRGLKRRFLSALGPRFEPRTPLETSEECASKLLP